MDYVDEDDSDHEYEPDFEEDEIDGTAPWDSLDTTLSRLAQRVHYVERNLTLQLCIRYIGPEPFKPDHLLSKFLGCGGLLGINC
jgi:hypothetical protein